MEIITALLVASACAAVAAGAVRWRARRRGGPGTGERGALPAAAAARDVLENIRLQDVVLLDGMELVVTGLARFEERERHWFECRLLDGKVERWLLVQPQDPDAAIAGERVAPELGAEPSEAVEHDGKVFHLERCGHAEVSGQGDLGGVVVSGQCATWDYRRPGPDRLWVRRGPAGTATFAGQRVGRHLICVLPGS